MNEVDWKQRTREQWSGDPCGSTTSKSAPFGSREFFDEVERQRYEVFSPWMRSDLEFDRHPGKKLLEVGVGMGSDHVQWARGGAICTGIDLTPKSIEITRNRFELYGLKSDLRVMDAEKLDFPDESFDLVYSFGVIHHTPDTQACVDEMHRVLKPGGRAIIMLYHRDSWHMHKLVTCYGLYYKAFETKTLHDLLGEGEASLDRKALPLVKVYSRGEGSFLFRRFRKADTIVRQLTRADLKMPYPGEPAPHWKVPVNLSRMARSLGAADLDLDAFEHFSRTVATIGTSISDKALAELGAVWGWNLVIFAQK